MALRKVLFLLSIVTSVGNVRGFLIQRGFVSTSTVALPTALSFAQVLVEENAPRDIGSMEEWAITCGVQRIESLQLTGEYLDGYLDVSVMTTDDIAANTPILFIPNEMILSSNKAVDEFGRQEDAEKVIIQNNAESELRQYYLMLKVLVEWERGEDSPWYPYLNSLPRYFSNGASMTPFCYKCVPPLVAALARKERANLNHLSVKRVSMLSNDTKGKAELWRWAFQIVYTRSFDANDGSGDLCMVPMLDMFNHGSRANVEYAYDEYGNCHVQTTEDVAAGSPLCMSYGDPTNPSFLFARYGFLDETSPACFCKMIPSHINEEMRDIGYAENRMLFYRDTGDASQEVWDVLLYQILNDDRPKQMKFYEAHMAGDFDTKQALHQQYYSQTSAKLLEHIDGFLQQLDELSNKAYGRDIEDHPRLPLILRHNEFVKNTFLTVRSRYFG